MTLLSISLMTVPERAKIRLELLKRLAFPVSVHEDQQHNLWRNAMNAWNSHSGDWHMVIQDDAFPCQDFLRKVSSLLTSLPYPMYSFYHSHTLTKPIRTAYNAGVNFLLLSRINGCVATVIRSDLIPDMLAFTRRILPSYPFADDERIADWMEARNILCCLPLPELVNHRPHEKSIIKTHRVHHDLFIDRFPELPGTHTREYRMPEWWRWKKLKMDGYP